MISHASEDLNVKCIISKFSSAERRSERSRSTLRLLRWSHDVLRNVLWKETVNIIPT